MKISFYVPNLLSWSGEEFVNGGLNRYAWALIELMQEMGWEVEVHQNGNQNWIREVKGVKVVGHRVACFSPEAVIEEINSQSKKVLYSTFLQKTSYYKKNSIVISHGVCWDSPDIKTEKKEEIIRICGQILEDVDLMISCDYNFLNVMRAIFPACTEKIKVIPNFVELNKFNNKEIIKQNIDDKIKILYPYRLDNCRASDTFLQLADYFLNSSEEIEILTIGDKNSIESNLEIVNFLKRERVITYNSKSHDMPEIYQKADIVIIPSKYSEETSFSCIEAMACGKAVIASNVGGLCNLIINGYNGILVSPKFKSFRKAVQFLIDNQKARNILGERASQVVKAFSHNLWKQQWRRYLQAVYCNEDGHYEKEI
ncbi:glycosyltransferase family 4 protein [Natronospora cellulosivora (SeqCode)]